MTKNHRAIGIHPNQVKAFLTNHLDGVVSEAILIGAGAWSRCFGFRRGDDELVIRFGNHVDDFEKDKWAWRYATPDLPISRVIDIGAYGDGYYAISTRAYGVPLEEVSADQWRAVVPALVAAMEAMRTADISSTTGVGSWGMTATQRRIDGLTICCLLMWIDRSGAPMVGVGVWLTLRHWGMPHSDGGMMY